MLLELVDGGIVEILTDTFCYRGCDTCDYGSSYINEFTILFTDGHVDIEIDEEYEYAVSEDYLMKLFLNNVNEIKQLTEEQVVKWIETKLLEKVADSQLEIKSFLPSKGADNE